MTVSGRNTRLPIASARNDSRMVRAHAGASAATWRPERLIEKLAVTLVIEGTL